MKYFDKKWYKEGCKDSERQKEYLDYMNSSLPKWYVDFSIHDDQIKSIIQNDKSIFLNIISDDIDRTEYQFIFHNPLILENCRVVKSWCIADELYIDENSCEYHLMLMDYYDNSILNYFTVKCTNIELIINNKTYKIFNNTEFSSIWEIK